MKNILLIICTVAIFSQAAPAYELYVTPLKLSVSDKIGFPRAKNVVGLDLCILLAETNEKNVPGADKSDIGLQTGLFCGRDNVYGIQVNLVSSSATRLYGFQFGGLCGNIEKIAGIQANLAGGYAASGTGIQVCGLWGGVDRFNGIQASGITSWNGSAAKPEGSLVNGIMVSGCNFTGTSNGMQAGGGNIAGVSRGIQAGALEWAREQNGVQAGVYNYGDCNKGVQAGVMNFSENMAGLQIGVYNSAGSLKGVQIGIVNHIKKGGILPVMPVMNCSF